MPRAEELIGASEAAYMAGTIDFLSLIDAQQTLLQYRLECERSSANQQQRLAEVEMLVGTDLSGRPAQSGPGEQTPDSTPGAIAEQQK